MFCVFQFTKCSRSQSKLLLLPTRRQFHQASPFRANMEAIRNTIAENFGGPSHNLVDKENYFDLEMVPDLTGKVAVVTGGSEGIGFGSTHTLLSKNVSKIFVRAPILPYSHSVCCNRYTYKTVGHFDT